MLSLLLQPSACFCSAGASNCCVDYRKVGPPACWQQAADALYIADDMLPSHNHQAATPTVPGSRNCLHPWLADGADALQEHGRLFCGQCGNAALNKVEVVVGGDGVLQYGVRRRHNLRGTRYPLPKPQVNSNPAGTSLEMLPACWRAGLGWNEVLLICTLLDFYSQRCSLRSPVGAVFCTYQQARMLDAFPSHACNVLSVWVGALQGGKTAQPLLREDVLLQKMHRTKPKRSELPDAFAPEYGQETWFSKPGSGARRQQCDQVCRYVMAPLTIQ